MAIEKIVIKGAKEHNLKNIDLEIPRNKLVVITGLSGSGKSSLAFDTIYAEGQRRYVESLSAYARQFLEQMEKPDVESIEGLSPAISIEQKTTTKNPRSTVGTVTEIYDYLRLLFARIGKVHCFECGREIASQTVQQIVDQILKLPSGAAIHVLAPIVQGRKGEYRKELEGLQRDGFLRVKIDGKLCDLADPPTLDKKKKHYIDVLVDRLLLKEGQDSRLADSVEIASKLGRGIVKVDRIDEEEPRELIFSEKFACPRCGVSYPELSPRLFSFNSPHGACSDCGGLGVKTYFDPDLVVPDKGLSLRQGAIQPWSKRTSAFYFQMLESLAEHYAFDLDTPFRRIPESTRSVLLHGSHNEAIEFSYEGNGTNYTSRRPFEGVIGNLSRRYIETDSESVREEIEQYMNTNTCPTCGGTRLKRESLFIKVGDCSIHQICRQSIKEALTFFKNLKLDKTEEQIARLMINEIINRLGFMVNVGLDYLSIERTSATLSGGEGQRIRLATQIGTSLVGVLYILDEPSIGLHQRDNARLIETLKELRNLGNTVIVVEHDEATIRSADHIIDMGPGAGMEGGRIVAKGRPSDIVRNGKSLTGRYLAGKLSIPVPEERRSPNGNFLTIRGARANNLKGIDVSFPIGLFTCVTGVSGSGKSTLIIDTLQRALSQHFYRAKERPGEHSEIEGLEHLDKIIDIDQAPIGRTPRSNPATYTGLFTHIRDLYARLPQAKMRGYRAGRFSFNVKGGRCEACKGDGIIKIEMHFLPDVYVTCEVCGGKRYNRETLEIRYKGKSISDILNMSVDEALDLLTNIPPIKNKLGTLSEVGLGYIKLGQAATTLSGGEAQRIKLSRELSKTATGRTLYILDEPTTGLHFDDIHKLLHVLDRLAEAGNTIIVIEHNMEVIKTADYVIDLGPEGGEEGGRILSTGTPEEIATAKNSYTGTFLKKALEKAKQT